MRASLTPLRAARTALLGSWALAVVTSTVTHAHAQDKAACAAAYTAGQEQRNSSRFTAARETLSIYAQPTCKDWMVAECVQWLEDVERRQPTVVLSAEGTLGEIVDIVRVDLEDGTTLTRELDGRALALDPGKHTLTFVARDGTVVPVSKIIAEGQKATQVKAIFEIKAHTTAATTQGSAQAEPPPQGARRDAAPKGNPFRTGGFSISCTSAVVAPSRCVRHAALHELGDGEAAATFPREARRRAGPRCAQARARARQGRAARECWPSTWEPARGSDREPNRAARG